MVGGNGPRVTWGLAARYADEVNLDAMAPGRLPEALATIRQRCEEVDRDPATLRISVHLWLRDRAWLQDTGEADLSLGELLSRYTELGVYRVMAMVPDVTIDDGALAHFAEIARAVGAELAPAAPAAPGSGRAENVATTLQGNAPPP
jgi:alkanesulfonate monooxygenase SsuD/methylene tetrahydromethanopterin reductase-like flavin-dependent oxidoreductase (luciferase family)